MPVLAFIISHLGCDHRFPTGPTPSLTVLPEGKLYENWDTGPTAHCNPRNWSGARHQQEFETYLLSDSMNE